MDTKHYNEIVKEFNKRFGAESMKKLTEIVGRLDGYPEYVTAVKDKDEQMMWTLGNKFIETAMQDEDENLSVVQEYYNDKAMQKFIHDVILSMSKYKILRGEMPKAGEDGEPTTAPRSVV